MRYQVKHVLGFLPKTCRRRVEKCFYFTISLCTEAGCPEVETETM